MMPENEKELFKLSVCVEDLTVEQAMEIYRAIDTLLQGTLNSIMLVDDLGGHHGEGLGTRPDGIDCGECNKVTCKGCVEWEVPGNV